MPCRWSWRRPWGSTPPTSMSSRRPSAARSAARPSRCWNPSSPILARRLGRPVRLACRPARGLLQHPDAQRLGHPHPQRPCRAEGRILARETETLIDVGAYVTGGNYLPGSMLQRHVRLYDIPAERYEGRAVYTNTPPTGAFRGYGSPQINAAGEIHSTSRRGAAGIDPVALRLANAILPGAIEPYSGLPVWATPAGVECLQPKAQTPLAGTPGGPRPRAPAGWRRGVGMAAATHVNGCFPGEESTTMTLRAATRTAGCAWSRRCTTWAAARTPRWPRSRPRCWGWRAQACASSRPTPTCAAMTWAPAPAG